MGILCARARLFTSLACVAREDKETLNCIQTEIYCAKVRALESSLLDSKCVCERAVVNVY